jgi:hypothetical protein
VNGQKELQARLIRMSTPTEASSFLVSWATSGAAPYGLGTSTAVRRRSFIRAPSGGPVRPGGDVGLRPPKGVKHRRQKVR